MLNFGLLGDAINIFIQIVADNEDAINQLKTQNSKNEDLLKEHEALKEKLESTLKDLAAEKESKSKTRSSGYGLKTDDAQNGICFILLLSLKSLFC